MPGRRAADFLLGPAAAAFAGGVFCIVLFGPQILAGRTVDWLMSGDRAQNFFGWHFYRHASESFPLGRIPALLYPTGASLAYADAFPWFSIALKPLSPLLPPVYQIAGLWLTLAFALQGWFAFRVLDALIGDRAVALAGSLVVIATPVLVFRNGHLALCAHWLVLAAFAVFLWTIDDLSIARFALRWAPLLVLACGTHPYLAAMVIAIAFAGCANGTPLASLRLRDRDGPTAARWSTVLLARAAVVAAVSLLSLYSFGYAGDPSVEEHGFGVYSANLNTLVNPLGLSRLLPTFPAGMGQYEGYGFLGIASLALFAAGTLARLLRLRRSSAGPVTDPTSDRLTRIRRSSRLLAVALVAMFAFALSSHVLLGGTQVATANRFYARLEPLPSVFRSSGRFVWPLHYALVIGSVVWIATGVSRRSIAVALCLAALALQGWDSFKLYTRDDIRNGSLASRWNPLRSYAWLAIPADYAEIRLIPPYIHDATCLPHTYPPYFYIPFAYLAGTFGMRINSGHLSRQPAEKIATACKELADELADGRMSPDAVYVVSDDYLPKLRAIESGVARCGVIDRFHVCVRADRATELNAILERANEQPANRAIVPSPR